MSTASKPNIGATMVRIHKAITRGLDVSGERSSTFGHEGYPDAATKEGFLIYARTMGWVINAHHQSEDHVVFPYLRAKLPDAPFDELAAEHVAMEGFLQALRADVKAAADQAQAGEALNGLNRTVARLAEIWHPHIEKEQLYLYDSAKTDAVMDADEQIKLSQEAAEHSQKQADPAFMMPFVLYNLPPEERAAMAQLMPPAVVQEMVPVVWKDKWAPMKAFLLD